VIAGQNLPEGQSFTVRLEEGAAVGYRWYDKQGKAPLFPFGHGLSFTTFTRDGLAAALDAGELRVTFRVHNTGSKPGKHTAQVYVSPARGGWEAPKRLAGFAKVELAAGATGDATVRVDPRLVAMFDVERHAFHVAAGAYRVTLASSSRDAGSSVTVTLPERWLPAGAGAPH
jgi:beta-glucosidase